MRLPKGLARVDFGPRPRGKLMAHIDTDNTGGIEAARHNARMTGHVQNAQVMLVAAGIAAFCIVAVATTMLTTIL